MRAASQAWMAPAVCCLLAAAIYATFGDIVGVGVALWFSWCMTRADDNDHQWLRYLGWIMLVTITLLMLAQMALTG